MQNRTVTNSVQQFNEAQKHTQLKEKLTIGNNIYNEKAFLIKHLNLCFTCKITLA